jgi:hypothetical protein
MSAIRRTRFSSWGIVNPHKRCLHRKWGCRSGNSARCCCVDHSPSLTARLTTRYGVGPAGRLRQPGAEPFRDRCQLDGIADTVDVVDAAVAQSERDGGDEVTFAEGDHCGVSLRR